MRRGYFAIGIYCAKNTLNIGTLWRTAHLLGAAFIFTVGARYKRQPSDTMASARHVPLFEFDTLDDMKKHLPKECRLVAIELAESAVDLAEFKHPEQACYLLGAEDIGLPNSVLASCHNVVRLRGERSMNVAVAGSIVLYHREALVTEVTSC